MRFVEERTPESDDFVEDVFVPKVVAQAITRKYEDVVRLNGDSECLRILRAGGRRRAELDRGIKLYTLEVIVNKHVCGDDRHDVGGDDLRSTTFLPFARRFPPLVSACPCSHQDGRCESQRLPEVPPDFSRQGHWFVLAVADSALLGVEGKRNWIGWLDARKFAAEVP